MASIRGGNTPVLVVVDVQVGVVADAWDAPRVVGKVAQAVERARAQKTPVVWVQHHSEELVRDSEVWQWAPELKPAAGETLVHKQYNSAFEDTVLEDELQRLRATELVLAGLASNWCIRATAYGALDRGYDLTLVKDAHTTSDMDLPEGVTIKAADIVRDLNIAMTWLRYPGRRNRTVAAAELDFSA